MALKAPRLDDRTYDDLREEAIARIPLYTPEWTDHHASDPGITLIELFAYMSDIILYRLNRVPDKHYIKFMELIGMQLHEAVPARVDVSLWLTAPQPNPIVIPSNTEVATIRTETDEAITFTTDGDMEIQIPQLSYLMTSYDGGGDAGRIFNDYNVAGIQAGFNDVPIFASEPPRTDDALYIGFEQDLSNHLIGIEFEVDSAEGAGINPKNPPYVWEVLDKNVGNKWLPIDVDHDDTLGLNQAGLMRVHLPELSRATRNEISAYWVRLRLDLERDDDSRYEVSPRMRRITVTSWGGTVSATNVTRVHKPVLGRSDGTPGQKFYLEHTPVATRTTDEYIIMRLPDGREQKWEEVQDFSTSAPNDRHYMLDSETGEVRLAPALRQPDGSVKRYGMVPPKGTMVMMSEYRYGGGQQGNVGRNTIRVLKTPLPYIRQVLNRHSAEGGLDAESLENAKMRVPGHLRSLQRAVTATDFEYLTDQAAPGKVGRVYCLQPPLTDRGENKVLIIPKIPILRGFISPESLELPTELRNDIRSFLDERRLLSTQLEVTTPTYQWVATEVRIAVTQHYDEEKVRQSVEDRLFSFLNPLTGGTDGNGWTFGRDLLVADVMAALAVIEGVQFVRQVKLFPVTYENRQFRILQERTEVPITSDGVVVSYQHTVIPE